MQPTLLRLPEQATDWRYSVLALEWAEAAGYVLDDWQAWLVAWTFARKADGTWAARDICVEVPRQNGKNIWLEVVEMCGLLLFGDRIIMHSAHRADTSRDHFLSMQRRIRDTPFLLNYMPNRHNMGIVNSNGKEALEFDNGSTLFFKARAQESGRGPSPQKLVYDEALVLTTAQVGTAAPSLGAQPMGQVLFASSPPKANSEQLHALRDRTEEKVDGDDIDYLGVHWNNEQGSDPDDYENQKRVNPSLGRGRMTRATLMANKRLMNAADYIREHGGVPEAPEGEDGGPISEELWNTAEDSDSAGITDRRWAVSVSPDRKWATIGVAAVRSDKHYHVEWKVRKPGTDWVVPAIKEISKKMDTNVRIHTAGPEGSFLKQLDKQKIKYDEVTTPDVAEGTATFLDALRQNRLHHLGQKTLTDQTLAARLRLTTEGASIWGHRKSEGAIDALKACTVALSGIFEPEQDDDDEWWSV